MPTPLEPTIVLLNDNAKDRLLVTVCYCCHNDQQIMPLLFQWHERQSKQEGRTVVALCYLCRLRLRKVLDDERNFPDPLRPSSTTAAR